jgi:P27 family predicted phage terminase small subunit
MGRPKLPIATKKAQKTSKPCRDKGKQNPTSGLLSTPVDAPDEMDAIARAKFLSLQKSLIAMKILEEIDIENVALAAIHWSDYINARNYIIEHFTSIDAYLDQKSSQTNLIYQRMVKSLQEYKTILSKYGSTPADRSKIVIPEPKRKNNVESFMDENKEVDLGI